MANGKEVKEKMNVSEGRRLLFFSIVVACSKSMSFEWKFLSQFYDCVNVRFRWRKFNISEHSHFLSQFSFFLPKIHLFSCRTMLWACATAHTLSRWSNNYRYYMTSTYFNWRIANVCPFWSENFSRKSPVYFRRLIP